MDALQNSAVVVSSAAVGQTWTFRGPGAFQLVVSSVDDRTMGTGPLGPYDHVQGLKYAVKYAPRTSCDFLA